MSFLENYAGSHTETIEKAIPITCEPKTLQRTLYVMIRDVNVEERFVKIGGLHLDVDFGIA